MWVSCHWGAVFCSGSERKATTSRSGIRLGWTEETMLNLNYNKLRVFSCSLETFYLHGQNQLLSVMLKAASCSAPVWGALTLLFLQSRCNGICRGCTNEDAWPPGIWMGAPLLLACCSGRLAPSRHSLPQLWRVTQKKWITHNTNHS